MKLAEALIERKGMQQKITDLEARITGICTYQEGSEPSEDVNRLLKELGAAYENLSTMVKRVNRTNSLTLITDGGAVPADAAAAGAQGRPLSDLIVERDLAVQYQNTLRRVAAMVRNNMNSSRSEIRIATRINLDDLEQQIAHLGEKARKLDAAVQGLNWAIALI